MSETLVDSSKRTWLIASGCVGAVGGVATAVPFVSTFQPSERAKAAGAAVEVDVASRLIDNPALYRRALQSTGSTVVAGPLHAN